jgi:hypothetical protein
MRDLTAEDANAGRVERRHPGAARVCLEQAVDPLPHLACRLVREGDGEDLPGPRLAASDQVRDAVREHARLSAAGACQHQQRSFHVRDRVALLRVQTPEDCLTGQADQRLTSGRSAFYSTVTLFARFRG